MACSKFISEEKSRALIGKIAHLTSNFRANELQRSVIVANRVKTVNKKIYYSINKIHEAIENGRKITFHYFNYDIKRERYSEMQTDVILCRRIILRGRMKTTTA